MVSNLISIDIFMLFTSAAGPLRAKRANFSWFNDYIKFLSEKYNMSKLVTKPSSVREGYGDE